MEVAYRRELNETWMIIPGKEEPEEFECRMLSEMPQGHFLKLKLERQAGTREYAFAISRGYSLKTLMDRGKLDFTEIRQLFSGLAEALEECEEYLLDRDHVILDAACIYGYPDFSRLRFCCHPGIRVDFFENLRHFVENLLENVDHQDRQATEVLYECARVCDWPNYRFEDLLAVIGQGIGEAAREAAGSGSLPEEPVSEPVRAEERTGRGRISDILRVIFPVFVSVLGAGIPSAAGVFVRVRTGVWDWRWFAGSAAILALGIGLFLARRRGDAAETDPLADRKPKRGEEEATGETEPGEWTGESGGWTGESENWRNTGSLPRDSEMKSQIVGAAQQRTRESRDIYGDAPTEWIPGAWDEEATVWLGQETSENSAVWMLTSDRVREHPVRLTHFPFVIGKMRGEVDHVLEQSTVSRIHARLEQDAEGLWITDCRSTNGTWRNGRRLPPDQRIRLEEGDEIAFADVSFRLEQPR